MFIGENLLIQKNKRGVVIMKNKFKLLGIAVVMAVIVFSTVLLFTGCGFQWDENNYEHAGGDGGGGGSGTTFTSGTALNNWLSKQPENSPSNPYRVKLNVSKEKDLEGHGIGGYASGGKYVYLDLSGSTITSIRENAFTPWYGQAYDSLVGIILPSNVTNIEEEAFCRCTGLTSITISDSVKIIEKRAFAECHELSSVTIGNSVTSIEDETFAYCKSLTSVNIPNSVQSIGKGAFNGCDSLTSVTIPNNVKTIGEEAFAYCERITSLNLGNGVTSIGHSAFYGSKRLTSVTIPSSVRSLRGFNGCTGLASVTIENGVTSIGDYAFTGCSNLTSITIPSSVQSIGNGAFNDGNWDDIGLISVTFEGNIPESGFANENIFIGSAPFKGNLVEKYLAEDGGKGTYTRPDTDYWSSWTKQE
jgi:hypothetical protein